MDRISPEIDALVRRLHARGRLRVWSIIISVFGDSIQPHGGTVSASTLGAILDGLNIEPGAMRSALSRLGKEGWIERHKIGRTSQYSLTNKGLRAFLPAAQRIYSPKGPQGPDLWTLATIGSYATGDRAGLQADLLNAGFLDLGRGAFLFAGDAPDATPGLSQCLVLKGQMANIPDRVKTTFAPDAEKTAYQDILAGFAPLQSVLADGAAITPEQAIVARTMLIHDWRRVVLHSAGLPPEFYPEDWPAESCRAFVAELYKTLTPAAEDWLAATAELTTFPAPEVLRRFS